MASEKSQALYVPTDDTYEEKSLKNKEKRYCSRFVLVWVLVALLIALTVGLCVQFWFPVKERVFTADSIDAVHVLEGPPVNRVQLHYAAHEKQAEVTTPVKEEANPPWHLDFLINPTRLCETWDHPDTEAYQKNPEVKLLVLVPSATGHFAQRSTIRKTWGSVAVQPHGPVRLGFILGITPNATEQNLISHESEVYGDIIQADFVDTFRNLTTKSVLMLKWVAAHCSHARYFLKTDDDTFVNLPVLARVLQKPVYDPAETFIGGYVRKGSMPTRIPSEKHYVSEEDFPEEEYPPYADGSAYMTTGPTAIQLFDASQRVTPFLPLEDIFITGLLADDINAKLVHEPSFQYTMPEESSFDRLSSLATVHSVEPDDIDALFQEMTKAVMEAINFPESSSSSSDFFGSMSVSNFFPWPEPEEDSEIDAVESLNGGNSEEEESKEDQTIFDIFNMLRNQLGVQEEDSSISREKDLDSINEELIKGLDTSSEELPSDMGNKNIVAGPMRGLGKDIEELPTPVSVKRINKGNFLNSEEEKQILEALNEPKKNSSFVVYFK